MAVFCGHTTREGDETMVIDTASDDEELDGTAWDQLSDDTTHPGFFRHGATDYQAESYETEVHLLRTEYPEASRINASVATSSNLPNIQTAWAYLNVTLIDSADPDLIRRNVDIATDQFITWLSFPLGLSLCNLVYADLHLREENPHWHDHS
jgi:hypothetical protein